MSDRCLGLVRKELGRMSRGLLAHGVAANRLFGSAERRALRLALPKSSGQLHNLLPDEPVGFVHKYWIPTLPAKCAAYS